MAKILVVDDEADLEILIKQKFRQQIREQQYEFIFAMNGREAQERIAQHHDLDIVLSDINMPEMDGLSLLSWMNESFPLIKAVIVSAYGDMDNIRTAMNRGAFDFITKPVDFKDLSVTMQKTLDHVEQIRKTLQAIKENNILRMYVDEHVLNFMGNREFEASLTANEIIEATVAFIDVCSFTSISENAPADTVVQMLNTYFDLMATEIIEQGGYIDKFIGDAVMAVFRGDYHLDRAIEASISIRNKIEKFPAVEAGGTFLPRVSIGINSGDVVSGNIGSASIKRLDYTVIGDTVNVAQRLQTIARENQVIISESAYQQVQESFNCRLVGEMDLKNKARKMNVYEVME